MSSADSPWLALCPAALPFSPGDFKKPRSSVPHREGKFSVFLKSIHPDLVCNRRKLLMGRLVSSMLNNQAHRTG